jgi:hypothetical protein
MVPAFDTLELRDAGGDVETLAKEFGDNAQQMQDEKWIGKARRPGTGI